MKTSSILGVAFAALLTLQSIGGSLAAAHAAGTPPAQTWLSPPPGYFALPATVVGKVWPAYDGQRHIRPRGMDAQSAATYSADVYRSSADAQTLDRRAQKDARFGALGPDPGSGPRAHHTLAVLHPAGGWAYGTYDTRAGTDDYSAGATFHNLVFFVAASCHLPRGAQPDPCREWTVGALELLLGRAHLYAAAHPGGDTI